MRNAEIKRDTAETKINMWLDLDGTGKSQIDTGVGFLDHMLTLLAKHARFDMMVECEGDTYVDDHHSVEDIGICLGRIFSEAVGDKRGIKRYGSVVLPMDEALILAAVDISGRSYLGYGLNIPTEKVGTFDTELVEEFMLGFTRMAGINLHFQQLAGSNSHHIIEGAFKALARALREAVSIDEKFKDDIPSTKGSLSEETKEEEFGPDMEEERPRRSDVYQEVLDELYNEPVRYERYEDIESFDDDYDGQEILEYGEFDEFDEEDEAYMEAFDGAGYEEPSTGLGDDNYSKGIAHGDTIEMDADEVDALERELREKGLL